MLNEEELKIHLGEQIDFLKKSCRSYDLGDISEAKRMATALRILLYDPEPKYNSKSKSILKQLNKKDIQFYNTAYDYNPKGLLSQFRLLCLGVITQEYIAPLDNFRPKTKNVKMPFNKWWTSVIFVDNKKRILKRSNLILYLANQDGGAHVDDKLNPVYFDLTRNNSIGLQVSKDGILRDLPNPHLHSIRQISHEVLKTLKDEFPEYFISNTIYGLNRLKSPYDVSTQLGIHFYRSSLFDDAIFELTNALTHDSTDYKIHYYLGRTYISKLIYDEALKEFTEALKIKPDHPILLNSLGFTFYLKGDYDKAIEQYITAIHLPKQYAGIHINLAEALFKKGDIPNSLIEYYLLTHLFPKYARGYYSYGNVLYSIGFIHQSILMFKKAIELGFSNADLYYKYGMANCFIGSINDAIDALKVAIQLDPAMAEPQNLLLKLIGDKKNVNKIIRDSLQKVNIGPDIEFVFEIESDDYFL